MSLTARAPSAALLALPGIDTGPSVFSCSGDSAPELPRSSDLGVVQREAGPLDLLAFQNTLALQCALQRMDSNPSDAHKAIKESLDPDIIMEQLTALLVNDHNPPQAARRRTATSAPTVPNPAATARLLDLEERLARLERTVGVEEFARTDRVLQRSLEASVAFLERKLNQLGSSEVDKHTRYLQAINVSLDRISSRTTPAMALTAKISSLYNKVQQLSGLPDAQLKQVAGRLRELFELSNGDVALRDEVERAEQQAEKDDPSDELRGEVAKLNTDLPITVNEHFGEKLRTVSADMANLAERMQRLGLGTQ